MPRQSISGRRGCSPSLFYHSSSASNNSYKYKSTQCSSFVGIICNPSQHHHLPKSKCPQCQYKNNNIIPTPGQLFGVVRFVDIDYITSNIYYHVQPSILASPSHNIMESSSSSALFIWTSSTLLSRVIPTILGSISYVITSITSFILPVAYQLQRMGETLLTAFLLLSFVQALVALYQYRYGE